MKIFGLIFLWLATVAAPAQTNLGWPVCRDPVRVFGTHAVSLTPLFRWWASQRVPTNAAGYTSASIDIDTNTVFDADRPLAAWHRVTGTHVGMLVNGSWAVDAVIYTSPGSRTNARIILNHPPNGEEQNFCTLKAELDQATQQITNAAQTYQADVKAEQKDRQRVDFYRRSWDKVAPDSANNYAQLAAQKQKAADAAANQQQQLETERDQIEQQLKTIPAMSGIYHVDWFAVMLGRSKQGLPIYDLGVVSPSPP